MCFTYCFNSVPYHILFVHACVELQVLLYGLSITLVVALAVVLCLKTQEVILQQQVSLGEKTVKARIKLSFEWKQILG